MFYGPAACSSYGTHGLMRKLGIERAQDIGDSVTTRLHEGGYKQRRVNRYLNYVHYVNSYPLFRASHANFEYREFFSCSLREKRGICKKEFGSVDALFFGDTIILIDLAYEERYSIVNV